MNSVTTKITIMMAIMTAAKIMVSVMVSALSDTPANIGGVEFITMVTLIGVVVLIIEVPVVIVVLDVASQTAVDIDPADSRNMLTLDAFDRTQADAQSVRVKDVV